jgi:CRISPR-associated protein Cas4
MDSLIPISKINDFLYSPKSLYFHSSFEDFDTEIYHQKFQARGNLTHEKIDTSKYSSSKRYLQGIPVYCEKYGLVGKIDLYDKQTSSLIERKFLIQKIHKGYIYQLYAQMFCLVEMGFEVKKMFLHSLSDNTRYPIKLPDQKEIQEFEAVLNKIRNYDLESESRNWKTEKIDDQTIYSSLYF